MHEYPELMLMMSCALSFAADRSPTNMGFCACCTPASTLSRVLQLCFVYLCTQDSIASIVQALEQKGGYNCDVDLAGPSSLFSMLSEAQLREMKLTIKDVNTVLAAQGGACSQSTTCTRCQLRHTATTGRM